MAISWNTIKDYVEAEEVLDALGLTDYHASGNELIMLCPLHDNRDTPAFGLNKKKKVFNCFSCGAKGNLADLVAKVKEISYKDALEWLRSESRVEYDDPEAYVTMVRRLIHFTPDPQTPNDIPIYNVKVLHPWMRNAYEDPSYFESRGIDAKTVENLCLGYDPTHSRRYKVAHSKDWAEWVGPAAIIPVYLGRELVGWQERWIGETPLGLPKYTNTDNFPRKHCLYEAIVDLTISTAWIDVFVVEAPLTAAYLYSNGYNAVATFGAEANPEQIQLLRRFRNLIIAYDNDKAGRAATGKLVQALKSTNSVMVAPPYGDEKSDPGDIPPEELGDWINGVVPASLYEEVM